MTTMFSSLYCVGLYCMY